MSVQLPIKVGAELCIGHLEFKILSFTGSAIMLARQLIAPCKCEHFQELRLHMAKFISIRGQITKITEERTALKFRVSDCSDVTRINKSQPSHHPKRVLVPHFLQPQLYLEIKYRRKTFCQYRTQSMSASWKAACPGQMRHKPTSETTCAVPSDQDCAKTHEHYAVLCWHSIRH